MDIERQKIKQPESFEESQAKMEIDSGVLTRIREIMPYKNLEGLEQLHEVSYATNLFGDYLLRHFMNQFKDFDFEKFKQSIISGREKLKEMGIEVPESAGSLLEEKIQDIALKIAQVFLRVPFSKHEEISSLFFHFAARKLAGMVTESTSYSHSLIKSKEARPDFKKIIFDNLKDSIVVDLGCGEANFFFSASMIKAKKYIGVDLPREEENYGQEEPFDRLGWFKFADGNELLKIAGVDFSFCEGKTYDLDIVEALYTKIPDNSSCFVVLGVDASYKGNFEWAKMANELIAKKTKVGGIVVTTEDAIIGNGVTEFGDFEKIYAENTGIGPVVWRRKS